LPSDPLIRLDNLTIDLAADNGPKRLVRRSEIEVPAETAVGLVGESGSGKTLTVSSILGLVSILPGITAGELWLCYDGLKENVWPDHPGPDVYNRKKYYSWQKKLDSRMKSYRGKKISIIFQRAKASLNPFLKIKNQIFESLKIAGQDTSYDRMLEWLANCGFGKTEARRIAEQYPHQLSGGQAQRAVMAVTLSTQADTIIADEPTTGLDAKLQVETLVFMKKMMDRYRKSAIIVSHNLYSVSKFTEICYVMYRGLTVEKGPTAKILRPGGENHPYTQKLREGVEKKDSATQPSALEANGCPYLQNCHIYATMAGPKKQKCRDRLPDKIELDSDRFVRCWAFE
jgi:ABC-type dipeptide/oligopeptide/nickel transport system ATPase component